MNGNDFLNAMTDVDDKHIISAEKKPSKHRGLFIGAMSAVAAALITVTAVGVNSRLGKSNISTNQSGANSTAGLNGITSSTLNSREPRNGIVFPSVSGVTGVSGELPKISPRYHTFPSGMGGESYKDVKLDESNPWNPETNFETLPVFRSLPTNPDHDFMTETLKCVIETLGYDLSEMNVTDEFMTEDKEQDLRRVYRGYGAPEYEVDRMIMTDKFVGSKISAKNDEVSISINMRYEVEIMWRDGFKFPKGLSLEAAGEYFLNTFSNMFRVNNPVINTNYEYNNIEIYDGTGTEKFVNYQMNKVKINIIDDGVANIIRFNVAGCPEKVGDYPIISLDEAKERLYNNIYTTILGVGDYKFTGAEQIGGVDLLYLTHSFWGYDMPYYCFYVKTGDDFDEKAYFDYYVPAIADEYLLLD